MNVSHRITELRQKQNLSTNKLANLAGISQSYLRDIELENKNPTVETLGYICDALNISLKEFFSKDDIDTIPELKSAINKLNQTEQLKLAQFINEIK